MSGRYKASMVRRPKIISAGRLKGATRTSADEWALSLMTSKSVMALSLHLVTTVKGKWRVMLHGRHMVKERKPQLEANVGTPN